MAIWRIPISNWTPKATNTHSPYAIYIAFPPQQRLHKRAPLLLYTYIDCHVLLERVKIKWTFVESLSLCTDRTALRVDRGVALLFLDHGTKRERGVSFTPRAAIYPE